MFRWAPGGLYSLQFGLGTISHDESTFLSALQGKGRILKKVWNYGKYGILFIRGVCVCVCLLRNGYTIQGV